MSTLARFTVTVPPAAWAAMAASVSLGMATVPTGVSTIRSASVSEAMEESDFFGSSMLTFLASPVISGLMRMAALLFFLASAMAEAKSDDETAADATPFVAVALGAIALEPGDV